MRNSEQIRPVGTQHSSESLVNKGRIYIFMVFINYFAIIYTNYSTIMFQTSFCKHFYQNNTFDCTFSIGIILFSHLLKSDTTFGYSLIMGSLQIRPLFTGS